MHLLLPSVYLGPVSCYACLYASETAVEDRGEHYVKQTYRNRCYIATPQGPQALALPVERALGSHTPMRDLRLSDHGNWPRQHWNALVSAYENSPYFEYYADDFRPLYEKPAPYLVDFNEALRQTVCSLLGLPCIVSPSSDYVAEPAPDTVDLRGVLTPKRPDKSELAFRVVPYYQVFRERTGFLPDLSIVDLLFNLGPESRLILRKSLSVSFSAI